MTIIIHRLNEEDKYFFSYDHCQKDLSAYNTTPISYQIPCEVVPRPGLEDGIIRTVGDLIFVYHRYEQEIKNPDKKYQTF